MDHLLQEGQGKLRTENWIGFSHVEVIGILGKKSLVGVVVLQTRLDWV